MKHQILLFCFICYFFYSFSQLNDPLRPQFHALPPSNWINDPNGPIFYKNNYHLFFQYNPNAAVWGNISWGHMTSPDMIHWEWKDVAMYPGSSISDPDHGGCWTGSAQIDITGSQLPTILYTAVRFPDNYETQMLAVASDDSITSWNRSSSPVIRYPPIKELNTTVTGFRDPSFWYDNEISKWRLILGSGIPNIGGCILQYTSNTLQGPWEYIKPLIIGNITYYGDNWECPDLFELQTINGNSSRWVLIFGANALQQNYYMIGNFDKTNNIFIPDEGFEHGRILDAGNFYASKTMLDSNTNLRILWGWSPEDRSIAAYNTSGWAGIQTIPRVLYLSNDKSSLLFEYINSLSSLNIGSTTEGNQIDIEVSFSVNPQSSQNIEVQVLLSTNKEEYTNIIYQPSLQILSIDRTYSSLSPQVNKSIQSSQVYFPDGIPNTEINLRIIIDHSIIEVFANNAIVITSRVYPTLPDSTIVKFSQTPLNYYIHNFESIY